MGGVGWFRAGSFRTVDGEYSRKRERHVQRGLLERERHSGSPKDSCNTFGKGVDSGSWKLLRKKSLAAVESSKAERFGLRVSHEVAV